MKKLALTVMTLSTLLAVTTQAADLTGKLGLNYSVGPAFVIGGSRANDVARVGPQVGAGAEYGLTQHVSATFAYDDQEVGFQTQTMTFGGTFRPMPQQALSPFFHAALGFGHRYSGDGWDKFAMNLAGGVEHFFTENLSAAAQLSYFYVAGSNNNGIGDVHVIEPGLRMNFYFGRYK